MNKRDVVIGLIVIFVIIGLVYWIRRPKAPKLTATPIPSVENKIEDSFKITIPDDVDRANLKDVSGGNGSGIATRKYTNGNFTHTVLADLPDPEVGTFYEGWLVRGKSGDFDFSFFSTGKMRIAKGGYILDYNSTKDYSDFKGVIITSEKVDDKSPEKHILEGSF